MGNMGNMGNGQSHLEMDDNSWGTPIKIGPHQMDMRHALSFDPDLGSDDWV